MILVSAKTCGRRRRPGFRARGDPLIVRIDKYSSPARRPSWTDDAGTGAPTKPSKGRPVYALP